MKMRRTPFFALPVCVAGLSAFAAGCQGLPRWGSVFGSGPEASGGSEVVVERYDDAETMTPAERDRRFREVYARGVELAGTGQYGLALGSFEQAVKLRPDSTEALFNLAACHDAIGDPMKAIGIYRQLLRITPDDADCYANLGTSFIKMYHREQSPAWRKMAWEAWNTSLRIKPDQPMIREYLARSQEE